MLLPKKGATHQTPIQPLSALPGLRSDARARFRDAGSTVVDEPPGAFALLDTLREIGDGYQTLLWIAMLHRGVNTTIDI
jgi:hypothetical protein